MKVICDYGGKLRHYADSSAHRNRYPYFLPDTSGRRAVRLSPAIKISRLGTHIAEKFASRYYDSFVVAAMFFPEEVAGRAEAADESIYISDSAYCVGDPVAVDAPDVEHTIALSDRRLVFSASSLTVDKRVSEMSKYATLKMGDLIIFADVSLDAIVAEGDMIDVKLDGTSVIELKIK